MSPRSARCTSKSIKTKARDLNISSLDIENYLQMSLTGYTITQFRERDKLIGVDLRAPRARSRRSVANRAPGDALAEWNCRTAGRARALHLRARIRRGVGARPSADDHRAGRRAARGAGYRCHHPDRQGARRRCTRSCRSGTGSKSAARSRRTPRRRLRSMRRCRCSSSRCWCS